jgi:hypothetical protein
MSDLLKCRRCRWVGAYAELRKRPHPKEHWRSDKVCPRCACKTFTPVEEPKHD